MCITAKMFSCTPISWVCWFCWLCIFPSPSSDFCRLFLSAGYTKTARGKQCQKVTVDLIISRVKARNSLLTFGINVLLVTAYIVHLTVVTHAQDWEVLSGGDTRSNYAMVPVWCPRKTSTNIIKFCRFLMDVQLLHRWAPLITTERIGEKELFLIEFNHKCKMVQPENTVFLCKRPQLSLWPNSP
jgi:hypothetical protein